MKFNESIKEIKQIGEIKKNNVSIDKNNIDFIVTILSTNLYSNPIESFIRETVSNAWDSHVEAGVSEPVILELGKDTENNCFCRIQDFGVGLSEERFNQIYRNIGSSTKRNTNNQIGAFGIGRFSALSYSDVVYITSVYNGEKFKYMMYKDGNTISIDMLHKQITDERNGLEVFVNVKTDDVYLFSNAINKQLVYFENLYIINTTDITNVENDFNDLKIKKYNYFNVNTLNNTSMDILLGKVKYPLRLYSLTKYYNSKINNYPISLKFNIGDLEVTPNREEILYSEKNIKVIEKKIDNALDEIKELTKNKLTKNYNNPKEFINAIRSNYELVLIENDNSKVSININKNHSNITLNNEKYENNLFIYFYEFILGSNIIKCKYNFDNLRISNSTDSISISNIFFHNKKFYLINDDLKHIEKEFIRDTFDYWCVFIKHEKLITYYRKIKKLLPLDYKPLNKKETKIHKIIFKYVIDRLSKELKTFSYNDIPKKWIEERKEKNKEKRKNAKRKIIDYKQSVTLHILRESQKGYMRTVSDPDIFKLDKLYKQFGELTVYGEKKDKRLSLLYFAAHEHINILEVAPTKIKLLKEIKNFVKIDNFLKNVKYKLIRNIATAIYIEKKIPHITNLNRINNINEVSKELHNIIKTLNDFKDKYFFKYYTRHKDYEKFMEEIYSLCLNKNWFNEEIRSIVDSNYKILHNAKCLFYFQNKESIKYIEKEKINITVDYVLARKLFKVNIEAINKLKSETIFNIKKENNESN